MAGKKVKIALPVLAGALLIFICLLTWAFKCKGTETISLPRACIYDICTITQFHIILMRDKMFTRHDLCSKAGKKRKQEKHKTLILGDFITSEGFGEGSPSEGFEFSVVSFSDITTVTNNFHQSFLIGQGGFGKVYKVKSFLIGQEGFGK